VLDESRLSGSYVDGRITCRFRRWKQPLRNDSQLYPMNGYTEFYVLLARGPSQSGMCDCVAYIDAFILSFCHSGFISSLRC